MPPAVVELKLDNENIHAHTKRKPKKQIATLPQDITASGLNGQSARSPALAAKSIEIGITAAESLLNDKNKIVELLVTILSGPSGLLVQGNQMTKNKF